MNLLRLLFRSNTKITIKASDGTVIASVKGTSCANGGLKLVQCSGTDVTIENVGPRVQVSGYCAGNLTLIGNINAVGVATAGDFTMQ